MPAVVIRGSDSFTGENCEEREKRDGEINRETRFCHGGTLSQRVYVIVV
jgi:hypothetical protein